MSFNQRRNSIYDPERRDKDEERMECTFQPCLEKSLRGGGGLSQLFNHNGGVINRESLTSTCFEYDASENPHSSLKKRCRSQQRNHTMQNFALATSLTGYRRTNEQFFADMTMFNDRKEGKIERLRKTLSKEALQRHKEDFDAVSMKS